MTELAPPPPATRLSPGVVAEDLWHSLSYFGSYRLVLGILLIVVSAIFGDELALDTLEHVRFMQVSTAYIALTLISFFAIRLRAPSFSLQLAFHVSSDVACIVLLSYFGGGIQTNLGMLLLVTLAATGMISRGRITLFYAALASIAILLEHAYSVLTRDAQISQFLQAGILSISYFAVAWLAHTLSRYAVASEKLASLRGIDLNNMAEANRLMIQDMPDGMLVVDEHGVVRQHNPSVEQLLGHHFRTTQETLLSQCSPVLHDLFQIWRNTKTLNQDVHKLPVTGRLVKVRFLPVEREGFWGAVVVLEDLQRLQEQAQQVKLAALGRLTMNIAHEVRNPLSAISYAAELLKEENKDPAHHRLPQIILDNVTRLNRIIQDVMQLNRRDRIQTELLDLSTLLPPFIENLCQIEHVARDIFKLTITPDCRITFDQGHWEQILWNLCRNAVRFSQKKTASIHLTLARTGGQLFLQIEDDGRGVSSDALGKLFEPFFTTDAQGTGLGLYIARELCHANGAKLEYLAGATPGACFKVTFGNNHEQ